MKQNNNNSLKLYLVFSDATPNGIVIEQSKLKTIRGYKTIVEINAAMAQLFTKMRLANAI
jgi:hypothetical protein